MFTDTDTTVDVTVTPDRVFLAVRLINSHSGIMSRDQFFGEYSPIIKNGQLNPVITIGDEIGVFHKEANGENLTIDKDAKSIETANDFRIFCNGRVWKATQSVFYQTSLAYSNAGKEIIDSQGLESTGKFAREIPSRTSVSDWRKLMNHYRQWAHFLGYLISLEGKPYTLWPNMAIALSDFIHLSSVKRGDRLTAGSFFTEIEKVCPLVGEMIDQKNVPIVLSNGLRTLHDTKVIRIERQADAAEVFHLEKFKGHAVASDFTHITYLGGK